MTGQLELPDGSTIAVFDGMTIGRVAACDVTLADEKASRRHARIVVQGSVVEVEDLGSRNGILLNGSKVSRRMLRDGDAVQIGTTVLTYRSGEARSGAAASDDLAGVDLLADEPVAPEPLAPEPLAPEPAAPAPPRPAPPRPAPPATPEAADEELIEIAPRAPAPAPAPPPRPSAPPPREVEVLEFEDEIVEVRKPTAPAPGAKSVAGAAATAARGAAAAPVREGGVLQYSKKQRSAGPFGDDLAQMSGPVKYLVYAAAIAVAGGLGWLAFTLAS